MSDNDDPRLRSAFDHLATDAERVDTMDALRAVGSRPNRRPIAVGLLGAAAGVAILIAAVVAFRGDDNETTVVAATDSQAETDLPAVEETATPVGPPTITGTTWVLQRGNGPLGEIVLVDGWPITLLLEEHTLGGTAACNSYGAAYALDGSALTASIELARNEMGCSPQAVMVSESAYLAALVEVKNVYLEGWELVLSGPETELVFAPVGDVPTATLVGTTWELDTLIQGETASTVSGDPALLMFGADGTFAASTGCRDLAGDYIVNGATVQLTSFGATGECPADLAAQDSSVISVLEGPMTVEIDGDRMTLTVPGNEGLIYRIHDASVPVEDVPDEIDPVEPVPDPPAAEVLSVTALLEERPRDVVTVEGQLLGEADQWILCDQLELQGGFAPICVGRWVVLTNQGPPDPDLLTQVSPTVTTSYTEATVVISGFLVDDQDRFELAGVAGVAQSTPADRAVLDAFVALAGTSGPVDDAVLALMSDELVLGLGETWMTSTSSGALADPTNWVFDIEDYRAWVGPFSALELLRSAGEVTTLIGPHAHCASPPVPALEGLGGARRLSIQPATATSCLEWWTVDIFVDESGQVVGITMDRFEP